MTMRTHGTLAVLAPVLAIACGSALPPASPDEDAQLAPFSGRIRAVDNHSHLNSTPLNDQDLDALPLEGLPPFALPARWRPESPVWLDGYRALYGYRHTDLSG